MASKWLIPSPKRALDYDTKIFPITRTSVELFRNNLCDHLGPHCITKENVPGNYFVNMSARILAHRNRSDFCDLRLRCPSQTPEISRFPRQDKAMLHCDLRVRWKVASDLRFRAAISEPKTPSFCSISGDLAQSRRK